MPQAKLADIKRKLPPVRRVTGTAEVPLNERGRQQAQELAATGKFDKVYHAPRARHEQTAKAVDQKAQPADFLDPMRLGEHEGKPVEGEQGKINDRFLKKPHVPTGTSPFSGERGESPHQFRRRVKEGDREQARKLKPGEKVLNVTSGRNIRMIEAPDEPIAAMRHMTKGEGWAETGSLMHKKSGKLVPVKHATEPGQYYSRHGETEWNKKDSPGSGS